MEQCDLVYILKLSGCCVEGRLEEGKQETSAGAPGVTDAGAWIRV